ncbi:MAG: erythromycin esterase family protein, partial [Lewinella sp.]
MFQNDLRILVILIAWVMVCSSVYLSGQKNLPAALDTDAHSSLDSLFGTAQIIYLGEQSHRDGATFDAKRSLVEYLHERHGFTVLAFEGDAFALDHWNTALQTDRAEKAGLHAALMPFWSWNTAVDSLAGYLIEQEGHLQVAGFDNQLTTQLSLDSFTVTLRQLLPMTTSVDFVLLDELVSRLLRMDSFTEGDAADAAGIRTSAVVELENRPLTPDRRIFWAMLLESLVQEISYSAAAAAGRPEAVQNARDRQMAKNLVYLTRQYPGQKIICWGASYHFAKDLSSLQLRDTTTQRYLRNMNDLMGHDSLALNDLLELKEAVPMAQVFAELSTLPTLSLAFAAGTGYTDQGHFGEDTLHFPVPSAPPGSWEEQFINQGDGESIHVFSETDTVARHLAVFGYLPIRANWSASFDAVYFTPTMYPAVYLPASETEPVDTFNSLPIDTLSGRVIDARTKQPVAYAYVYSSPDEDPLLTNLSGFFRGPGTGDSISITAIGYATLR